MSSQRVVYYPFGGVNKPTVPLPPQADPLEPARGVLLGIMCSLPIWAVIYLTIRAIF